MNTPYAGQLLCVPYRTCPPNWMFCQGQVLAIADYDELFQVIGNTYGGDGQTTFALPDLRGRVPMGQGQGPGLPPYGLGQTTGVEVVWLTTSQIPPHNHWIAASTARGNGGSPAGAVISADANETPCFAQNTADTSMNAAMVASPAPTQGHENRQPFLVLNWIIALTGIFPAAAGQEAFVQ